MAGASPCFVARGAVMANPEVILSEDELGLLTFLHEKAAGYGPRFVLSRNDMALQLGWPHAHLHKAASYLEHWALVGISETGGPIPEITGFYLTGRGENYARRLERKLQEEGLLPQGKAIALTWLQGASGVAKASVFK